MAQNGLILLLGIRGSDPDGIAAACELAEGQEFIEPCQIVGGAAAGRNGRHGKGAVRTHDADIDLLNGTRGYHQAAEHQVFILPDRGRQRGGILYAECLDRLCLPYRKAL